MMCICIYIYVYVYVYMYICIHVYVYVYVLHMYMYMYMIVYAYLYVLCFMRTQMFCHMFFVALFDFIFAVCQFFPQIDRGQHGKINCKINQQPTQEGGSTSYISFTNG